MKQLFLVIFSLFIFIGCTTQPKKNKEFKIQSYSYIDGVVIDQFGDKLLVNIEENDIIIGEHYDAKLLNKIIKNSLLIPNMKTYIGKQEVMVEDIRGNQITFSSNTTSFKAKEPIKIYLPKKRLAIVDFSVIGSSQEKISKVAMEEMTTKLVQSGQYIIVERNKLDTVLKEHKLIDSGLLAQDEISKLGKLVSADIILTGTFSKIGSRWKVNMRLVDVETGIILSAINDEVSSKDLGIFRDKDSSNLSINFENEILDNGWQIGKRKVKVAHGFDITNGANNTQKSYKINYNLKEGQSVVKFQSLKVRDLSNFQGIRLFMKAQKSTSVYFAIEDQNYDDPNTNKWVYPITVGKEWKEYKINFDYLTMANRHRQKNPGGDGTMDLDNISKVIIQVNGSNNTINQNNILWVDEISLY